jgi:signal peptidase I
MVPNLNIGDLLVVDHNYNYNNLKVGDIIVFNTPGVNDKGQLLTIVHRVADIITLPNVLGSNGGVISNSKGHNVSSYNIIKIIRTKGDANPSSVRLLD